MIDQLGRRVRPDRTKCASLDRNTEVRLRLITPSPVEDQSITMSVSVCLSVFLSVCLSVRSHISRATVQTSPNPQCMPPVPEFGYVMYFRLLDDVILVDNWPGRGDESMRLHSVSQQGSSEPVAESDVYDGFVLQE